MRIGVVAVSALLIAGMTAAAQPAQQAAQPTVPAMAFRRQGPPSPVVQPDGRVTFNLFAPNATAVTVSGDYPINNNVAMTKDEKGVWSVTLGPIREDFYAYHFTVDGVRTLDPQNYHVQRDTSNFSNWLIVPGENSSMYTVNQVPHGRITAVWYPSPSLNLTRRAIVYTPADYDAGNKRYPVLYLLHGGSGDEEQWMDLGRAPVIIENLIAKGKAVPMIVVMGNGNAWEGMKPAELADPMVPMASTGAHTPGQAPGTDNLATYPDSLVSDLIPYIDKNFRTKADAADRAIAGLSMGGAQTAHAAFAHPEQFAWVGIFSSAAPLLPNAMKRIPIPADAAKRRGPGLGQTIDAEKFVKEYPKIGPGLNKQFKLLYLAVGRVDGLVESETDLVNMLHAQGVNFVTHDLDDYGHDWNFWRVILQDFGAKIFKPAK